MLFVMVLTTVKENYIHVMDLANAHTKCLQYLMSDKNQANCEVFNVGLGDGATVLEAVQAFEKVSNSLYKA